MASIVQFNRTETITNYAETYKDSDPACLKSTGAGFHNSEKLTVKAGDSVLDMTTFGPQLPASSGIDFVDAKLVPALAGKTDVDVIISTTVGSTSRDSKAGIKISFQP